MSLLLLTRLPLLPAPPPEELSEENPILAYERLMASLRPPSNPSTNTTYQERAVREIVPRAPASFTPVDVNSNSSTGMRVYEIAQNTEQRYTGTETWGPTGGAFQQSWEERRAQMDFVAMSGCGSSVGGVAGAGKSPPSPLYFFLFLSDALCKIEREKADVSLYSCCSDCEWTSRRQRGWRKWSDILEARSRAGWGLCSDEYYSTWLWSC
jgi:hypothetical protein